MAPAPHTQDLPRSDHPRILSRRNKRKLFRAARKQPKIEYLELLEETSLQRISKKTAYRALKNEGLIKFRSVWKPKITCAVARERLQFE